MNFIFDKIILIDDDTILNHLNKTVIRKFLSPNSVDIVSFDKPKDGLAYIEAGRENDDEKAILLLDINMPDLSGWDVLDKMCGLEKKTIENITIYILSSSIDQADENKAAKYPLVSGFLSKPLSNNLEKIFCLNTPTGL